MNLNIRKENLEEIVLAIRDRRNIDYCVVYEFIAHQKLLNSCFSFQ